MLPTTTFRSAPLVRVAVITIFIALALAGPALAAPATTILGSNDPADQPADINGQAWPDLSDFSVSTDGGGILTVSGTFWPGRSYNDPAPPTSEGGYLTFSLGKGAWYSSLGARCDAGVASVSNSQLSIPGLTGSLQGTNSYSGTTITTTFNNVNVPRIGEFNCVTARYVTFQRSSASNPNSRYSSGCDCWYVAGPMDEITAYLPGTEPVDPANAPVTPVNPVIPAQVDLPKLTAKKATSYMRTGLGREFGSTWANGAERSIKCSRKTSYDYSCKVAWRGKIEGRTRYSFSGTGHIQIMVDTEASGDWNWYYSWTIKRIQSCNFKRPSCTKVYRESAQ